jgi:hypothetical protein
VDARLTAEVAGLGPVYETAYRLYREFTHSSMRAVNGQLNHVKEPNTVDEKFVDVVKSAQNAAVLVLVY